MTLPMNGSSVLSDDVDYVQPVPKKHAQRSSIQHWQLRDLIACPQTRKEVFYVNQNNVFCYNTETKQAAATMKELTFSPTSMTAGCGYLAAGGQRSQLMVRQLDSSWFASTTVGGSINNSLCISNHPATTNTIEAGDTRLLVCNNDETIKVYSLPSLHRITTLGLPTAVNNASVSPDGRRLCAVGDSNQVFLFDITPSGYYQRIATLSATNDAGFSASWNHSSDKFAVSSQDGFVSVWDIRYINTSSGTSMPAGASSSSPHLRSTASISHFSQSSTASTSITTATALSHLRRDPTKLAVLGASQHPQVKSACRTVKFSPSPSIDLLMFSEHVSYINVVDARTFDRKQSIRVSPAGMDMHISGAAWSPDSRGIFAGLESSILEYDVNTLSRRMFPIGTLI